MPVTESGSSKLIAAIYRSKTREWRNWAPSGSGESGRFLYFKKLLSWCWCRCDPVLQNSLYHDPLHLHRLPFPPPFCPDNIFIETLTSLQEDFRFLDIPPVLKMTMTVLNRTVWLGLHPRFFYWEGDYNTCSSLCGNLFKQFMPHGWD